MTDDALDTSSDMAGKTPWSRYKTPRALAADPDLSREEKAKLLQGWEEDVRRLSVATEEGMEGDSDVTLDDVVAAQKEIGVAIDPHRAPNKG
ncbi:MAG: hypothetical protein KDJ29_04095 [Hyphomicrobiales bacterium]|nr:hypothetical protein [Hyphomicrobiales bacterium]